MTPLLTVADVAARLRVSKGYAYEVMRRMPHLSIGKRALRVAEEDLTAWVEATVGLTSRTVAVELSVSEKTACKLMASVPHVKVGGEYRISPSELPNAARGRVRPARAAVDRSVSWLYFLLAESCGLIKIGFTSSPDTRVLRLRATSPVPLTLLATVHGDRENEQAIHARFAADRAHGEWFRSTPGLLAYIDEISARAA